jgi:Fe2+ transport system protein FeoA
LRYDECRGSVQVKALNELRVGTVGIVEELTLPDEVQHHLMHMGFVPEARVLAVRRAPAGDPTVYAIDGFEIALRRETARGILISIPGETNAAAGRSGRRAEGTSVVSMADAQTGGRINR